MKNLVVSNLKIASTETTVYMVAMETSVNISKTAKREFVLWRLYRLETFHFGFIYTPLSCLWDYRGVFEKKFSEIFYDFFGQTPGKMVCPWDTLTNISGKNNFYAKSLCNPIETFIIYWFAQSLSNPHSGRWKKLILDSRNVKKQEVEKSKKTVF